VDAEAGWLGSYGGEDSPMAISREIVDFVFSALGLGVGYGAADANSFSDATPPLTLLC